MWELDCEESWVPKNWCFWTVMLEKTLESPLDCKEIQPVLSEGDQPWGFFGRNDAKAETPVLWPPHANSWLIRKQLNSSAAGRDWGQEEKGTTEDEMAWGITDVMDMTLSELRELVMDREAWRAAILAFTKSQTRLSNWTELSTHIHIYDLSLFLLCVSHLSCIQLFATPWTVAHQAPLSVGFSRQEYWSGLPCSPPVDLPNPWIKPASPVAVALQADSFTTEPLVKPFLAAVM